MLRLRRCHRLVFGRAGWIARIVGALGTGITLTSWRANGEIGEELSSEFEFAIVLRDQWLWHGVEALRALVDDLNTLESIPRDDALARITDDVAQAMEDPDLELPRAPRGPHEEIQTSLPSAVLFLGQAAVFSGAARSEESGHAPNDDGYRMRLVQLAAFAALLARRLREWSSRQLENAEPPPEPSSTSS